jgi:hypothetical protein
MPNGENKKGAIPQRLRESPRSTRHYSEPGKIPKVVENIGTVLELRRIAKAYVIDYRNLTEDEIKAAIVKTAPQYY